MPSHNYNTRFQSHAHIFPRRSHATITPTQVVEWMYSNNLSLTPMVVYAIKHADIPLLEVLKGKDAITQEVAIQCALLDSIGTSNVASLEWCIRNTPEAVNGEILHEAAVEGSFDIVQLIATEIPSCLQTHLKFAIRDCQNPDVLEYLEGLQQTSNTPESILVLEDGDDDYTIY